MGGPVCVTAVPGGRGAHRRSEALAPGGGVHSGWTPGSRAGVCWPSRPAVGARGRRATAAVWDRAGPGAAHGAVPDSAGCGLRRRRTSPGGGRRPGERSGSRGVRSRGKVGRPVRPGVHTGGPREETGAGEVVRDLHHRIRGEQSRGRGEGRAAGTCPEAAMVRCAQFLPGSAEGWGRRRPGREVGSALLARAPPPLTPLGHWSWGLGCAGPRPLAAHKRERLVRSHGGPGGRRPVARAWLPPPPRLCRWDLPKPR